ncbi:MAG: hypothetical protein ABIQ11_00645 [Saprospiraceae bacterium]
MKPRYKVTGCARFFVFFIIFIPIVYFGAAYFRGEDGLQKMKDFFNKIRGKEITHSESKNSGDTYPIENLQKELDAAKAEIRELKNIIKEKEKEIATLKNGQ